MRLTTATAVALIFAAATVQAATTLPADLDAAGHKDITNFDQTRSCGSSPFCNPDENCVKKDNVKRFVHTAMLGEHCSDILDSEFDPDGTSYYKDYPTCSLDCFCAIKTGTCVKNFKLGFYFYYIQL